MIVFKNRFTGIFLFIVLSCFSFLSFSQKVDVKGKVRKDNKACEGVTIQISGPGITPQTIASKDNGSFDFELSLQKNYIITFSKGGLITKIIEFNTLLPADQMDIIYPFEFKIDLFDDLPEVSNNDVMKKPVGRIYYNPTYETFMDDPNYTKQIKTEQEAARKAAELVRQKQEKLRLDSLNKIWNDSLAKVKSRITQDMADKIEKDRLRLEKERARQDSVDRANAAAKAAALDAAKVKAFAESMEKARQDSLSKAQSEKEKLELQKAAREKAKQDSLARLFAEKNRNDSLNTLRDAAAAKALQETLAKSREKAKQDSILQAESAMKARQKFVSDSLAQAKLESDRERSKNEALLKEKEKQRKDSLLRADAEVKRSAEEARLKEKARQDSLSKAVVFEKQRKKQIEDSTAIAQKQQALERAQLEALAKSRQDSIATALEASKARQKFIADSTAQAKAQRDSNAKEEKDRLDEQARLKERQRLDLEIASALAAKERQKAVDDSIQKALTDSKAKSDLEQQVRLKKQLDSLALAKEIEIKKSKEAEEARRQNAIRDKARQDSLALADAGLRQKAEAERQQKIADEKAKQDSLADIKRLQDLKTEQERKARVTAEIEAKKQLLGKTNPVEEKPVPKTAPIPKIRDADYRDGVTDETITETNRVIYRTVVKKDGAAFNYQKIVYSWGGIFYFKNENSITEISFDQEIKNAKGESK